MPESIFFKTGKLGPLKLRNRSIRAAAFEGMCAGHIISKDLIDYHVALAKGGVAMTTIAYASVSRSGLSFPHQLLLNEESRPGLEKIVESVHKEGSAISIQIGHCGNMSDSSVTGTSVLAPTGRINLYGPTFPKRMNKTDIDVVLDDFRRSTRLIANCGFDAIEVHAGHGYLISQFLSPYTNKRKDEFGGSFENRVKFMELVLKAVKSEMPDNMALIVKMNSSDGFQGGISEEESLLIAKKIEECGSHAIVVSGGFVSKAPMYVLRGSMPIEIMAHFMKKGIKKFFVQLLGKALIKTIPFEEAYFLSDAEKIKKAVNIQVIPVGGMNSMATIEKTIQLGFEFIAIARALIANTNYVNELRNETILKSECTVCNYCVAKMYSEKMSCHLNETQIDPLLLQKIRAL